MVLVHASASGSVDQHQQLGVERRRRTADSPAYRPQRGRPASCVKVEHAEAGLFQGPMLSHASLVSRRTSMQESEDVHEDSDGGATAGPCVGASLLHRRAVLTGLIRCTRSHPNVLQHLVARHCHWFRLSWQSGQ